MSKLHRSRPSTPLLLLCLLATSFASARTANAQDYVALEPLTGKKVSVDGMLSEWPGGFVPLRTKLGSGSVDAQALIGYDAKNLYFALKTKDARIARTAAAGPKEDHLTWQVRVPTSGKTYRVDVYPGDPGKLPGVVKVDGRVVKGAEAVENPQAEGYFLEARLPWSALPEVARVRVGLRGQLRYTDASAPGRVRAVVAQGKGQSFFTLESETGLIQALLEPKSLGLEPARVVHGNVAGGPELERVAVYGHFLSIVGPGYRGGKQFYFNELHVAGAESIRRLQLEDFDGDGRSEIVIEKRIGNAAEHRDVLEVLKIGKDGVPLQVFAHEVAIKTKDGHIQNRVTISGKGRKASIEVAQGKAQGFDPASYREPTLEGVPSALLPWESVKSRTFRWQGAGLTAVGETSWTPRLKPARPDQAGASIDARAKAPPPPRPPTADELLDRVYALYRQDRRVGKSAPRFDFVTDVVEDETPERVLVHGKDIVVFGKGFKKGLSYTFITVGVKEPEHILDVTARDLVGDGKAEIIVRCLLPTQTSKELGGEVVNREALYVYKVLGDQLTRIFAAETGRALKKNRIVGAVAFTPSGAGLDIVLRPGRAIGWNQSNYPFPEDTQAAGGVEPLLLPWGEQTPRTYSFRDGAYRAR